MNLYFDRNSTSLLANQAELDQLADHLTAHRAAIEAGQPAPTPEPHWHDAGVLAPSSTELDPMVAGIVEVLANPARSVVLERFDGRRVDVGFVHWDRNGRVTITAGTGAQADTTDGADTNNSREPDQGLVSVTATTLQLLPALLTQAVGLRPGTPAPPRPPIDTTVGDLDRLLTGQPPSDGTDSTDSTNDLGRILGGFRQAWRATGAWAASPTGEQPPADRSLTVLSAGPAGLWRVERPNGASTPDSSTPEATTPDSRIRLIPLTPSDASRLLGDVVTGRRVDAPEPPKAPTTLGEPPRTCQPMTVSVD